VGLFEVRVIGLMMGLVIRAIKKAEFSFRLFIVILKEL